MIETGVSVIPLYSRVPTFCYASDQSRTQSPQAWGCKIRQWHAWRFYTLFTTKLIGSASCRFFAGVDTLGYCRRVFVESPANLVTTCWNARYRWFLISLFAVIKMAVCCDELAQGLLLLGSRINLQLQPFVTLDIFTRFFICLPRIHCQATVPCSLLLFDGVPWWVTGPTSIPTSGVSKGSFTPASTNGGFRLRTSKKWYFHLFYLLSPSIAVAQIPPGVRRAPPSCRLFSCYFNTSRNLVWTIRPVLLQLPLCFLVFFCLFF